MKVVCISNTTKCLSLTLGKSYKVIDIIYYDKHGWLADNGRVTDYFNYMIVDDLGWEERHDSKNFLTVEEYRDRKLNEILT